MEEIKAKKGPETGEEVVISVKVGKGDSSTNHKVTVDREDLERLSPGESDISAVKLVEESFKFLLEREPKESILSSFNLTKIGDYFPEYQKEIKDRLKDSSR